MAVVRMQRTTAVRHSENGRFLYKQHEERDGYLSNSQPRVSCHANSTIAPGKLGEELDDIIPVPDILFSVSVEPI
jgi:hypothetical protein